VYPAAPARGLIAATLSQPVLEAESIEQMGISLPQQVKASTFPRLPEL
jgi:hypothetical protein